MILNLSQFILLNFDRIQIVEQVSCLITLHLEVADFDFNIRGSILSKHLASLPLEEIHPKSIQNSLDRESLARPSLTVSKK